MTGSTTSPAPYLLRRWVVFLLVAGLAIGCYVNALGGSFVSDDHRGIVNNPQLREPDSLYEFFATTLGNKVTFGGFYRPITRLTYWIDLQLFGPNPFGFHLENLLWHTATALLVLVLLRGLWPEEPLMALMGASLFAVHPVHTEAVAWVSGRSAVLAAFWGLLAFLAHLRADRGKSKASLWRIAALAAWLLALFAKEMAAILPILLLMTDALLGRPSGWWRPGRLATRYGLYAVAGVAYVALRLSVLGRLHPPDMSTAFQGAPLSVRGPTMLKVGAAYVGRLLLPVNLNADWSPPFARGLTDGPLPLLALAFLIALIWLAWAVRRTAPPVSWGILWAGLALLPASNLLPFGEIGAERYLYFSSLGACVALAWVMTRGMRPYKETSPRAPIPMAGALGCAVLTLFAMNTIDRNRDWSDDLVLWEKTVRQSPESQRARRNLLGVLWGKGRYAEGMSLFKRALENREKTLGPDHPHVASRLNDLAMLHLSQGQYAQAEPLFRRALTIREKTLGPDHPHVASSLKNLAISYLSRGQYAQAEPLFKRALEIWEQTLGPDHHHVASGLKNLAGLYLIEGNYAKAESLHKRALRIREKALGPDHPDLAQSLKDLAELYRAQGKHVEAEPLYKRALGIMEKALGSDHPDFVWSLENLAAIYQEMGRGDEAKKLLTRADRIRAGQ